MFDGWCEGFCGARQSETILVNRRPSARRCLLKQHFHGSRAQHSAHNLQHADVGYLRLNILEYLRVLKLLGSGSIESSQVSPCIHSCNVPTRCLRVQSSWLNIYISPSSFVYLYTWRATLLLSRRHRVKAAFIRVK